MSKKQFHDIGNFTQIENVIWRCKKCGREYKTCPTECICEMEGEFTKRFQEIANHVPMGLLDKLSSVEVHHPLYIPGTFNNIVKEAKQEILEHCINVCPLSLPLCVPDCPIRKWFGKPEGTP